MEIIFGLFVVALVVIANQLRKTKQKLNDVEIFARSVDRSLTRYEDSIQNREDVRIKYLQSLERDVQDLRRKWNTINGVAEQVIQLRTEMNQANAELNDVDFGLRRLEETIIYLSEAAPNIGAFQQYVRGRFDVDLDRANEGEAPAVEPALEPGDVGTNEAEANSSDLPQGAGEDRPRNRRHAWS